MVTIIFICLYRINNVHLHICNTTSGPHQYTQTTPAVQRKRDSTTAATSSTITSYILHSYIAV